MKALIDTHALIWFLEDSPQLGSQAKEILLSPDSNLFIPVIVLCEFYYYLKKKKRLDDYSQIYQTLQKDPRIVFLDLQPDIVSKIPFELEMHDGLIAATLLVLKDVALLSTDQELKTWGKCPIIWD